MSCYGSRRRFGFGRRAPFVDLLKMPQSGSEEDVDEMEAALAAVVRPWRRRPAPRPKRDMHRHCAEMRASRGSAPHSARGTDVRRHDVAEEWRRLVPSETIVRSTSAGADDDDGDARGGGGSRTSTVGILRSAFGPEGSRAWLTNSVSLGLAAGTSRTTVEASQTIVADAILHYQDDFVATKLKTIGDATGSSGFFVLKRNWDETTMTFNMQRADLEAIMGSGAADFAERVSLSTQTWSSSRAPQFTAQVFQQEMFIRWGAGAGEQDHIILPGRLVTRNTASCLFAALDSSLPATSIASLSKAANRVRFACLVMFPDSHSSNKLVVRAVAGALPKCLVVDFACVAHTLSLCSNVGVSAMRMIDPMYSLASTLSLASNTAKVVGGLRGLVDKMAIFPCIPPVAHNTDSAQLLLRYTLLRSGLFCEDDLASNDRGEFFCEGMTDLSAQLARLLVCPGWFSDAHRAISGGPLSMGVVPHVPKIHDGAGVKTEISWEAIRSISVESFGGKPQSPRARAICTTTVVYTHGFRCESFSARGQGRPPCVVGSSWVVHVSAYRPLPPPPSRFFNGDWTSRKLHHHCYRCEDGVVMRCHRNDDEVRKEGAALLSLAADFCMHGVKRPAKSRWLSMSACNQKLCFGVGFSNILGTAFGRTLGCKRDLDKLEAAAGEDGDEYRMTTCKRLRLSTEFLRDDLTPPRALAISIATYPVDKLFVKMFAAERRATNAIKAKSPEHMPGPNDKQVTFVIDMARPDGLLREAQQELAALVSRPSDLEKCLRLRRSADDEQRPRLLSAFRSVVLRLSADVRWRLQLP